MGYKNGLKYEKILKINVHSTSRQGVLAFVRGKIAKKQKFLIVTPNPEIILLANQDKTLSNILNTADLALPDGHGLVWASKVLKLEDGPKFVIPGREMFLELVQLANKKKWRIFLLGGSQEIAKKTAQRLKQSYKRVEIEFAQGPTLNQQANPVLERDILIEKEIVEHINQFKPELLFIAFGAPKQEKWAYKWLPKLKIGGAMVVGGTFDYLAGQAKLPPRWLAKLGLEWLWRLFCEPWRIWRIFRAVVIFPLLVIAHKVLRKTY